MKDNRSRKERQHGKRPSAAARSRLGFHSKRKWGRQSVNKTKFGNPYGWVKK